MAAAFSAQFVGVNVRAAKSQPPLEAWWEAEHVGRAPAIDFARRRCASPSPSAEELSPQTTPLVFGFTFAAGARAQRVACPSKQHASASREEIQLRPYIYIAVANTHNTQSARPPLTNGTCSAAATAPHIGPALKGGRLLRLSLVTRDDRATPPHTLTHATRTRSHPRMLHTAALLVSLNHVRISRAVCPVTLTRLTRPPMLLDVDGVLVASLRRNNLCK